MPYGMILPEFFDCLRHDVQAPGLVHTVLHCEACSEAVKDIHTYTETVRHKCSIP